MKRFLGTRIATMLVTALIVVAVMSIGAFAAGVFNKPLSASATIVPGNPDLAFFSDAAATQPITTLDFGSVVQGESSSVVIYVKNVGNKNFTSVTMASDLDPAVGTISSSPSSTGFLSKSAVVSLSVTLNAAVGPTSGAITPTITFNANY